MISPILPAFRERHARINIEVVVEDRFVDIVAEGYDAGVRLIEAIERDMVQVRLTEPFRFVIVGAPSYLQRHPPHQLGPLATQVAKPRLLIARHPGRRDQSGAAAHYPANTRSKVRMSELRPGTPSD